MKTLFSSYVISWNILNNYEYMKKRNETLLLVHPDKANQTSKNFAYACGYSKAQRVELTAIVNAAPLC